MHDGMRADERLDDGVDISHVGVRELVHDTGCGLRDVEAAEMEV
jgi:hypothetical protein